MGKYEFNKIVIEEGPIIMGYEKLLQLGEEYLLANSGVLIDNEGNLVWNAPLKHYLSSAVYIKESQILLTDRIINFGMGGDFYQGIACIDMKTGNYKWKHFYDNYEAKLSLRKKEPDINKVRCRGTIDLQQNCIITDGFKINLEDGSYEYTGESKERTKEDKNILYSKYVKSFKEMLHWNTEQTAMVNIKFNMININGQSYSKEGYFFNKCDFIMATDEHLYFWGVPAKKNPKNTILFKYSKVMNKIEEEIEMPFRYGVDDVYEFFGKGILFITGGTIWLLKDFKL